MLSELLKTARAEDVRLAQQGPTSRNHLTARQRKHHHLVDVAWRFWRMIQSAILTLLTALVVCSLALRATPLERLVGRALVMRQTHKPARTTQGQRRTDSGLTRQDEASSSTAITSDQTLSSELSSSPDRGSFK